MSHAGLGEFSTENNQLVQVLSPALPSQVMKAYVETVLGTKLEPVRMKIDVQLFRIVPALGRNPPDSTP